MYKVEIVTSVAHRPECVSLSQGRHSCFISRMYPTYCCHLCGVAHVRRLFWKGHGGYESWWHRGAPALSHSEFDSHPLPLLQFASPITPTQ